MEELLTQLDLRGLALVLFLLFSDILIGASIAWKETRFDLQRLSDAFIKKGVPFFFILLFAAGVRFLAADSAWDTWADGAYVAINGTIALALLGSITNNLRKFGIDTGDPRDDPSYPPDVIPSEIKETYNV